MFSLVSSIMSPHSCKLVTTSKAFNNSLHFLHTTLLSFFQKESCKWSPRIAFKIDASCIVEIWDL